MKPEHTIKVTRKTQNPPLRQDAAVSPFDKGGKERDLNANINLRGKLSITIVDNSREVVCQSSCGVDWSQPEAVAQAQKALWQRFGDRVHLDYADISEGHGEYQRYANEKIFPLLIIGGEIRLSGQFDLRQLMDLAEVQLEIGMAK